MPRGNSFKKIMGTIGTGTKYATPFALALINFGFSAEQILEAIHNGNRANEIPDSVDKLHMAYHNTREGNIVAASFSAMSGLAFVWLGIKQIISDKKIAKYERYESVPLEETRLTTVEYTNTNQRSSVPLEESKFAITEEEENGFSMKTPIKSSSKE